MSRPLYSNGDVTIIDPDDLPGGDKTDADVKTDAIYDALKEDNAAYLNVTRQLSGGNSPQQFVGRFPADKFDFGQLQAHLQEHFGGGDYRVMLYAKGRVRANRLICIAERVKHDTTPDAGIATVLNQVMTQMERMNNQMLSIMQDKQSGGKSRMEMLQEMMLMKQMFSGDKNAGGLGQLTEALEVLKTLGVKIGGDSDNESSGFGGLLNMAAPLIQKAIETPRPMAPPQYRPNPLPAQPPIIPTTPKPQNSEQNKMQLLIQMGVNQLVTAARRNGDHHEYATMVLDNIPEDKAREFFNDPEGVAKLIKIQPEVSKHLEWFRVLGEHIKAMLGLPCDPEINALYDDDLPGDSDGAILEPTIDTDPDHGTNNLQTPSDS